MSLTPKTPIPEGAIRYNTDSNKMEVWIGDKWMQVSVTDEASGLGGRAFRVGGGSGGTIIETWNIATEGNAIDTGFDLTTGVHSHACAGSRTRCVAAGGRSSAGSPYALQNVIQFFEMTSLSNSIDFGDLTFSQGRCDGASNQTRMVTGGQQHAASNNTMNLITIQTTGNATDFGDLVLARELVHALESPTRGIIMGGNLPPNDTAQNAMDFFTFSTTGGALDFGNLTFGRYSPTGMSNNTRGLIAQGTGPGGQNIIDFVQIATTGNAQDFGDAQENKFGAGGFSGPTRCGFFGGYTDTTKINAINIITKGNSTFFGDLTLTGTYLGGHSDVHGGL